MVIIMDLKWLTKQNDTNIQRSNSTDEYYWMVVDS